MPDALLDPTVAVQTMTGWLVKLTKRRRYGRGWMYDLRYYDDWHEAQATYEQPGGEWQGEAIFGCVEGEPVKKLTTHSIAQLRAEARMG